jgi:outer membrane protein assembly factor BamB
MKIRWILLVITGVLIAGAILLARGGRQQHAFTFAGAPVAAPRDSVESDNQSPPTQAAAEDWPQWRGHNRDAISPATGLLTEWPENGPPLVWTAKGLGRGMAGVSVTRGRIFTMGNRDGEGACLIALNPANGEVIWATSIEADGEPNGTPTIDGDHAFAITYNGVLVCAETATGDITWRRDFVKDLGGAVPQWGFSESALIDGDRVVCTPGADDALIVALDKSTGEVIWKSAAQSEMQDRGHDGAGYSSIVISDAAGIRQYVQLVGHGLIGVSTKDGTPLWGYNRIANGVANIPTPIVHEDYVFASTGYGAGSALLRLEASPTGVKVNEVYFLPGNKMQNHHGGLVLVDGHIYHGNGHDNGLPMCVEFLTGKAKWGPVRGPGSNSAAVLYADGHLYFRYQNSVMALIEATPETYRLKSSFELPSHLGESWPHPVIADGRLYLRDQDVLMCYDVRAER